VVALEIIDIPASAQATCSLVGAELYDKGWEEAGSVSETDTTLQVKVASTL
jgi:hypothetical protein